MTNTIEPTVVAERAARMLGERVVGWVPVAGGYTAALRLRVQLGSGRSVFVKAAVNDLTGQWLRAEFRAYEALSGCDFLPLCLGFAPDGLPLLILEDLSAGYWPPPWRPGDVERVLSVLARLRLLAGRFLPGTLGRIRDDVSEFASWERVAADPAPFLALGLCSPAWLDQALPALLAADVEAASALEGNDLCHQDVRSDNLCLLPDGRTVLVDWNWAAIGNGVQDIAGWLPSLHAEGGPPPEAVLRRAGLPEEQPVFAALLAGYWAARAGLPAPPGAPRVRQVQRQQLTVALPWAARALGLPHPA